MWHKTASLSGIVSLWDKGQNNLFIHVWVETGPIEMVLTDCNTTLYQHRKWEEDRPHEIALDVTLRTLFTDFEWAYVLPKRSFPCLLTTPFCLEEMRQVSIFMFLLLCNTVMFIFYALRKSEATISWPVKIVFNLELCDFWFVYCICQIKVIGCNQCVETCKEKNKNQNMKWKKNSNKKTWRSKQVTFYDKASLVQVVKC